MIIVLRTLHLGTTGSIQVGFSAKCTSPSEHFNQIKNWKCHTCEFRLIPLDRITNGLISIIPLLPPISQYQICLMNYVQITNIALCTLNLNFLAWSRFLIMLNISCWFGKRTFLRHSQNHMGPQMIPTAATIFCQTIINALDSTLSSPRVYMWSSQKAYIEQDHSLGRTSGKSSLFSPLCRAYRCVHLATHMHTLYFRRFFPFAWRNVTSAQPSEYEHKLSPSSLVTDQEFTSWVQFITQTVWELIISVFAWTSKFAGSGTLPEPKPTMFVILAISVWSKWLFHGQHTSFLYWQNMIKGARFNCFTSDFPRCRHQQKAHIFFHYPW